MNINENCGFCGSNAGFEALLCKTCMQPKDFVKESDIKASDLMGRISYSSPTPDYEVKKKRKKKRTPNTQVVSYQEPWTKRFYQFTFGMFWLMLNLMGLGFILLVSVGVVASLVKYFAWRF
jgi:hypothetical protein